MSVLFLCTGNINRSAAGSVIANAYGHADVISAGTSIKARNSNRMAKRTREPLIAAGIDEKLVTAHRSQYVGDVNLGDVTAVIGFQPSHRKWCQDAGYGHIYHDAVSLAFHDEWTPKGKVPDPGFDATVADPVVQYLLESLEEMMRRVS